VRIIVICQNCGKNTPDGKFCEHCGASIQIARTFQQPVTTVKKIPLPVERTHAGFWTRCGAYLVDILIVWIIAIIFSLPIYGDRDYVTFFILLFCIILWIYFAYQESSPAQATLGKRAMKIKVISVDGNRISFMTATVRTIIKFFPVIGPLGWLLIAFSDNKQALHDRAAGTFVIF